MREYGQEIYKLENFNTEENYIDGHEDPKD